MSQGVRRLNSSLEGKNHEHRNIPLAQTHCNIPRSRKTHQENSLTTTASPFINRDSGIISPKNNGLFSETSMSYHNINKELNNTQNTCNLNYTSQPQRGSYREENNCINNSYIYKYDCNDDSCLRTSQVSGRRSVSPKIIRTYVEKQSPSKKIVIHEKLPVEQSYTRLPPKHISNPHNEIRMLERSSEFPSNNQQNKNFYTKNDQTTIYNDCY